MSPFWTMLLLALFPAAGNAIGGVAAEIVRPSRRALSFALHAAAGILVGVIAFELAPRSFEGAPPWAAALSFLGGGAFFLVLEALIDRLTSSGEAGKETDPGKGGAWVIFAAVSVDLFSDGLLIGAGSAISLDLALLLAIGQVTADLPEGFAVVANMRDKGVPRSRRLLLSASFVIPVVAGALISYLFLRDQSPALQLLALAFAGGLLLVAAMEEIIGEAHEAAEDSRASALAIVGGFALFGLIAAFGA